MKEADQYRTYTVFASPFDPCPPQTVKRYVVPPNVTSPVQPPGLPQYDPFQALKMGTLWPAYYSPYHGRK